MCAWVNCSNWFIAGFDYGPVINGKNPSKFRQNICRLIAARKWCRVRTTCKAFDAIQWHLEWLLLCHVEQIDPHFMEIHFYLYILSRVTSFVEQFMCHFCVAQCDVLCLLTRLVSPFILQDYVSIFFSLSSVARVVCRAFVSHEWVRCEIIYYTVQVCDGLRRWFSETLDWAALFRNQHTNVALHFKGAPSECCQVKIM